LKFYVAFYFFLNPLRSIFADRVALIKITGGYS